MARENEAKLIGRIKNILKDETNKIVQIDMSVIRRNGGRVDTPTLLFFGEHYEMVKDLEKDNFIAVKGFVATMPIKHDVICPNCGKIIKTIELTITKIIGIFAKKIDGIYSLNDFSEISNSVILLGPVCSPIRTQNLTSGALNAQYRMAIGRKIKIAEQDTITTDFPFITSFGKQAEEDAKRMSEGSTCWINGAIQTREIAKSYICECGRKIIETQNIMEVTPYNVEYLFNCKFE